MRADRGGGAALATANVSDFLMPELEVQHWAARWQGARNRLSRAGHQPVDQWLCTGPSTSQAPS